MEKQWYQSRTIWSAILKALSGILTSVALILTGELTLVDFLPGAITAIWSIIDMVIRYGTGEPIVGSRKAYLMKAGK